MKSYSSLDEPFLKPLQNNNNNNNNKGCPEQLFLHIMEVAVISCADDWAQQLDGTLLV